MELDLSNFDVKLSDDINSWEEVNLLYNAALKQITTKIEILNEEFQEVHRYNPIEHVKSRTKAPESIVKKLKRNGYESTIENMVRYVNDIAGIRIICSFTSDIYRIAEMISNQKDIQVLTVKDYIMNPKQSGYRSAVFITIMDETCIINFFEIPFLIIEKPDSLCICHSTSPP